MFYAIFGFATTAQHAPVRVLHAVLEPTVCAPSVAQGPEGTGTYTRREKIVKLFQIPVGPASGDPYRGGDAPTGGP